MFNFASLHLQARGWLHLPYWGATTKAAAVTKQSLATQAEIQCHHLAIHRACQRLAQTYPHWVQRRFDDLFLHQLMQSTSFPTALELAAAWDRQFGPLSSPAVRYAQMAELSGVANHFLSIYQNEYQHMAAQGLPRI